MSAARTPIDCTHKRANHQHGTPEAYILDKCRCTPCGDAAASRESRRRKLKAYGRYDTGRVDASEVRSHLKTLASYGIGLKRIAKLAGVSNATIGKIIYGDPSRNMPPRARVERHVHDAVLAVKPSLQALSGAVSVDSVGTLRRIQGLVWLGYSISYVADRIGVNASSLHRTMLHTSVQASTARAVSKLYIELENRPRVGTDHRSRISTARSRSMARQKGWLPPAAWDEELMDDPKHKGYPLAVAA
ncbi:MAG TPA: hypothetical protein DCR15_13550 [Arthrobacter bacterium]|nr:hypothetical protein [Arthrobacter sp.]